MNARSRSRRVNTIVGRVTNALRSIPKAGVVTAAALTIAMHAGAQVPASASGSGAAQTASLSALRIHVVNSADRPVPTAEVRVTLGNKLAAGRTDSAGVFRAEGLTAGAWHASVRRIGFKETAVDFQVVDGDNIYTIEVDEAPAELENVDVKSTRAISLRLRGFEERRQRGEPSATVTRKDIEKRSPVKLSQLLRGMPGIQVTEQNGVRVAVTARGTVPKLGTLSSCPLRMSVDGMLRPPFSDLDEVVPAEVHGIEVYYGSGRLPLALANFRTDNWCGLIAIWTRDR